MIDRLEREVNSLTDAEIVDGISSMDRIIEEARAYRLLLVGEADARNLWAEDGASSLGDWLAADAPMTHKEAVGVGSVARSLKRDMHLVHDAVADGSLETAKAAVLARFCTPHTLVAFVEDEAKLIGWAQQAPVDELPKILEQWALEADVDGPVGREERARKRRSLQLRLLEDGTWRLTALLDAETGALLKQQLLVVGAELRRHEDASATDVVHEPKTMKQRNVDALGEIVRRSTESEKAKAAVPLVVVHTDLETLAGGEGESSLEDGEIPIPGETARRLACDSRLVRLVLSSGSEVLDLGREVRTASGKQRRALIARDGHTCCVRGCTAPVHRCQVHHRTHHADGGPTDLANLVLVCYFHHHLVHEGGWELARVDGHFEVIPPEGRSAPPLRRRCAA